MQCFILKFLLMSPFMCFILLRSPSPRLIDINFKLKHSTEYTYFVFDVYDQMTESQHLQKITCIYLFIHVIKKPNNNALEHKTLYFKYISLSLSLTSTRTPSHTHTHTQCIIRIKSSQWKRLSTYNIVVTGLY